MRKFGLGLLLTLGLCLLLPALAALGLRVLLPAEINPRWLGYSVSFDAELPLRPWLPRAAWVDEQQALRLRGWIKPLSLAHLKWLRAEARIQNAAGTLDIPVSAHLNAQGGLHLKLLHSGPLTWASAGFRDANLTIESALLDRGWSLQFNAHALATTFGVSSERIALRLSAQQLRLETFRTVLAKPVRSPFVIGHSIAMINATSHSAGEISVAATLALDLEESREWQPLTLAFDAQITPLERDALTERKLMEIRTVGALWHRLSVLGPSVEISSTAQDATGRLNAQAKLSLSPASQFKPTNGTLAMNGQRALAERLISAALSLNSQSDQAKREAYGRAIDLLDRAASAGWTRDSDGQIEATLRWRDGLLAPQSASVGVGKTK